MAKYRAGIIGCGSIASCHANGYKAAAEVELVAVADPLERSRRGFQERFAIPNGHADAEAMLRTERLDLVSVCLWHPLHAQFTTLAAKYRPKAIICEKPMATKLAEADAMIDACEANGVKLVIGHQRRFNHSWTQARQLIASGAIGTPDLVTVRTGEGLLNCGTHVIDAMRYMLGDPETEWVMGSVSRKSDRYERGIRIEDCGMAVIQFKGGAQALIECDLTGGANVEDYSFRGSDGALDVRQRQVRLLNGQTNGWQVIETGYDDPWVAQASELIAWIEGGPVHRGEGRQARATLEILMSIYQSARDHEVVRTPLKVGECPLDLMVEEGKLPVTEPGRYDIRAFLAMEPADRERYEGMRRQGMHPRDILKAMGHGSN